MTPTERDPAFLWDMLDYGRQALEVADGLSLDDYLRDRIRQLALERAVEILGEAARQVSPEFQAAHPEIPVAADHCPTARPGTRRTFHRWQKAAICGFSGSMTVACMGSPPVSDAMQNWPFSLDLDNFDCQSNPMEVAEAGRGSDGFGDKPEARAKARVARTFAFACASGLYQTDPRDTHNRQAARLFPAEFIKKGKRP